MAYLLSFSLFSPHRFSLLAIIVLITISACQFSLQESTATATVPQTAVSNLLPSPTTSSAEATAITQSPPVVNTPTVTATALPYPVQPTAAYPAATSYPVLPPTIAPTTLPSPVATPASSNEAYLPFVEVPPEPTATPVPPTATVEPTPEPIPTLDFTAVRASLDAQGQAMAFVKIGFHVTLMEDKAPIDVWMERLDAAGVPVFLKSVDNAEPLLKAQTLSQQSGVPHTLVYRSTGDVPLYHLPPQQAAQIHWETHRDKFPPELDPSIVWVETINEVDKNRAEWLGQFALETAVLALNDGFKWAAFGWASGEPEPDHWQTPAMLNFLRLAGENPDRLAIALHEYSYDKEDIGDLYPYKIGRFQELFRLADQLGIPRPTVLITEWGWEYREVPTPQDAMRDIRWAAKLYAAYPQVKGAALWHYGVGCCFSEISLQTAQLIDPLTEYSLLNYFAIASNKTAVLPERYQP